jgi:iron complex outermembrane receptor protein
MKRSIGAAWGLLAALVFSTSASAQEVMVASLESLSVEQLMAVDVVTASKRAESLFATPSAVFVLTGQDILRSGATTIPEALRLVPGLHVARKDLNHYVVTSRGFNDLPFSDKLLVMIDGRALHSPSFSQVWWPAVNYPLEDIERIEVIRGPGSAVWGANAINGVINIITKQAATTPGPLITVGAGDKETGFGSARYGWTTDGGVDLRLLAMGEGRDGARIVRGEWSDDPQDGGPQENAARVLRSGLRADWGDEGSDHTAQVDVYRNSARSEGAVFTKVGDETQHFIHDDTYAGMSAQYRAERRRADGWTFVYQLYYDRSTVERIYFAETLDVADIEAQGVYRGFDGHVMTAGIDARHTRTDFTDTAALSMPDDAFVHYGLYAQDEMTLFDDRLKVVLGAKAEKNDYTDWQVQPNAKLAWIGDRWVAWTSVSKAVRLINSVNNHMVWNYQASEIDGLPSVGRIVGRPATEPEEVVAYEAGFRFNPNSALGVDVTVFENRYANVMDVTSFEDDATLIDDGYYAYDIPFANMYEGTTWGGDVTLLARPVHWANLSLSYSRTHVDLHPTASFAGREEEAEWINTATPINATKGRVSLDLPFRFGFDASVQAIDWTPGVGGQRYLRVDLRLSWRPVDDLEIAVTGRNLQNTRHKEYESQYMEEIAWVERDAYLKITYGL